MQTNPFYLISWTVGGILKLYSIRHYRPLDIMKEKGNF